MAAFNDTEKERFQEVEIKGHYGLFTDNRMNGPKILDGLYCYELRHGDDNSYPAALELSVGGNYSAPHLGVPLFWSKQRK